MAATATYIGIDKILSAFESKADTPFFSLWIGKARAEQNTVNDFEKAAEKLEAQIKAFEEADNNNIFVIALHPEKKVSYTDKDLKEATLMYCQVKRSEAPAMYQGNISAANYQILEKLNAIESRINAIEGEEVEAEEEGEEIGSPEAVLLDKINGIVNSPLVGVLMQLFSKQPAPVTALAGTDDLNEILNTLFDKGVTVQHLKKLASYPKEKITMLLTML